MHTLHVCLLGDFRLTYGNALLTTVSTPRLQALFAYLLLHRQAPQARQHVAFQFWPDSSEKQAHTNLRKLLFQLRNALPAPDRFLIQDHLSVQWRPDAPYTLDVTEVQTLLAHSHKQPNVEALARIAQLYQGELLPGCYEEWLLPIRQQLQSEVTGALEQLINLHEHQREYHTGIRYAQRLLGIDPLHEGAYRRMMQLHALNGNRTAALHHYHTCVTLLQQELGVEPDEETRTLYQRLLTMDSQPVQQSTLLVDTPLVGRAAEWHTLLAAWRGAQRGQAHFVSIAGEAGMGKTRLAEELLTWTLAQGIRSARTRSYEAEGGLAYAPVTEWLRAGPLKPTLKKLDKVWVSEVARLLPELLTEQPHLPPPAPLTEGWQRQRFFEALTRAILVEKTALLLVIDDLQWCDLETLTWLRFLLRFDPQARLLIVGTWRTEAVDEAHPLQTLLRDLQSTNQLTTIELTPLTRADTVALAHHVADQPLAASITEQLYQVTEGHPLFVVETMRTQGKTSAQLPNGDRPSLPPKVQSVIQARLAQLSRQARELVGLAATIGRSFTFAVLAHASQSAEETVVSALDELWQRRIVREQGETYDFAHDRIREVAYQDLSQVRRRLYHRRVAEALEAFSAGQIDEISAQLAAHYEAALLVEKAIFYWQRASERATAHYAQRAAIYYLSRVLALLPASEQAERYRLLLTRVKLYNHEAMRPEGKGDLAALQAIVEALDDGSNAAIRRRAEVALCLADYQRGIASQTQMSTAAEAVALAEQCGDEALLAQAYFLWAEADLGDKDSSSRLAKALTLARSTGLLQTEAEVLSVLGLYGIYSGVSLGEVEAVLQQSLATYQTLGDPAGQAGALGMLAYIIYTQREGNYAQAIRYCEQALQLVTDGWDAERFAKGNLGCLWYFLGEYGRAKPYLEGELAIVQGVQHWGPEAGSRLELGLLHQAMGDDRTAQMHLERSLQLMRDHDGTQQYRVKIEGQLALFYQRMGDMARATTHAEAALNFARNLNDPRVQGDAFTRCGRVLSSQGQLTVAADLFQQAFTCFHQMEQWNHTLMPLAGLAKIALCQGDPLQARARVGQVLAHLQSHQLDRTDEELYVYMTCYGVLQALNDPRAAALLRLAYEQLQVRVTSLESDRERAMFWSAPPHAEVLAEVQQRMMYE